MNIMRSTEQNEVLSCIGGSGGIDLVIAHGMLAATRHRCLRLPPSLGTPLPSPAASLLAQPGIELKPAIGHFDKVQPYVDSPVPVVVAEISISKIAGHGPALAVEKLTALRTLILPALFASISTVMSEGQKPTSLTDRRFLF